MQNGLPRELDFRISPSHTNIHRFSLVHHCRMCTRSHHALSVVFLTYAHIPERLVCTVKNDISASSIIFCHHCFPTYFVPIKLLVLSICLNRPILAPTDKLLLFWIQFQSGFPFSYVFSRSILSSVGGRQFSWPNSRLLLDAGLRLFFDVITCSSIKASVSLEFVDIHARVFVRAT